MPHVLGQPHVLTCWLLCSCLPPSRPAAMSTPGEDVADMFMDVMDDLFDDDGSIGNILNEPLESLGNGQQQQRLDPQHVQQGQQQQSGFPRGAINNQPSAAPSAPPLQPRAEAPPPDTAAGRRSKRAAQPNKWLHGGLPGEDDGWQKPGKFKSESGDEGRPSSGDDKYRARGKCVPLCPQFFSFPSCRLDAAQLHLNRPSLPSLPYPCASTLQSSMRPAC